MKKNIIKIALFIAISLMFTITVSAQFYLKNGYSEIIIQKKWSPRLNSGSNVLYYLSSNYKFTPYSANAETGVKRWNNSSKDISFTKTTTYWSSGCDIDVYDSGSGVDYTRHNQASGFAKLWYGSGSGATNNVSYDDANDLPGSGDYWCGEIFLNTVRVASSETNLVKEIYAHEAGHVLGLGDINTLSALMNAGAASSPSSNEFVGVYDLYNNR